MEILRYTRANPFPTSRALIAVTGPLVHIHKVDRIVHGNGVDIKVYGEMQIAAGEYVYAWELKLNTLEVLTLTPMQPSQTGLGYIAQARISNKGTYDNDASVEIYDDASNFLGPGLGPEGGSIWLCFIAEGE